MAIYDWPATRTFIPGTAELRVIDSTQRTLESPMSGYVQTLSMPGVRWGWGMDFSAHALAERDALEGFLLRLSGRQHRVRLWDLKRPRPRGGIQPSGVTMAATAAQFATTLQLAGCRGANIVAGGSFEVDSNADGLADGWLVATSDPSRTHSITRQLSYAVTDGTWAQEVQINSATTSDDTQLRSARYAVLPNTQYTLQGSVYCSVAGKAVLAAYVYNAANAQVSGPHSTASVGAGSVQLISTTFTTGPTAAFVDVYARGISSTGEFMRIDGVQITQGASAGAYPGPATLLAGDWLGLSSGQLVRVVTDATADDIGRMTVDVRHMLRSAVASGGAVTLDRPTALYVRTEAGLMLPRMAGMAAPPMSCEFVEAFA